MNIYAFICINIHLLSLYLHKIIITRFMGIEKIYTQKIKEEGEPQAEIIELGERFGFYGMELPFKMTNEVKEPEANDWSDEDGDDEYLPEDGLKMKAFDVEVKLGYKGCKGSANNMLQRLLDYLTGRDGSGVLMKMYSTYTKIGYNEVRFKSLSDDAELVRDDGGDILVIKMTFKVNDPVTKMTL